MEPRIDVVQLCIHDRKLFIAIKGEIACNHKALKPKVLLWFDNGEEDRNFLMRIKGIRRTTKGSCQFEGEFCCELEYVFFRTANKSLPFTLSFEVVYDNNYYSQIDVNCNSENFVLQTNAYNIELINKNTFRLCALNPKGSKLHKGWEKAKYIMLNIMVIAVGVVMIPWGILELLLMPFGLIPLEKKRRAIYERMSKKEAFSFSDKVFYIFNRVLRKLKKSLIQIGYYGWSRIPKQYKSVSFISQRSKRLEGNFKFVYEELSNHSDIKLRTFLNTKTIERMTYKDIFCFVKACACSQVVLVDEYMPAMYSIKLKQSTKLIQVWHACGAFKTFGFSRIGLPGEPAQRSLVHRTYDYVTVSSEIVRVWYAQGFGLPMRAIIPTGVPRTDIFIDPEYAHTARTRFYETYPKLKNKKILLFAPTFRGTGKETAYYPMENFQPEKIYEETGKEYAILIKQHPFVQNSMTINERYSDYILDMSDFPEINELLFVSDLIVTDYSSLIFEASLLNLPMLFYVYDLEEYTKERDFYFDFDSLIPGKKIFSQEELIAAINARDFQHEKVPQFAETYFGQLDGKSTQRVVDLIVKNL